jgi:hypothetical protein
MKRITLKLILAVLLIFGTTALHAQRKEKTAEEFKKISAIIDSSYYQFRVQSIKPNGRRTIFFSTVYFLIVQDTLYRAELPYIGRAFEDHSEQIDGIIFAGKPTNLEISRNEKRRSVSVNYEIEGGDERFQVNMVIGNGGYGTLYISSRSRQPITYNGVLSALERPGP